MMRTASPAEGPVPARGILEEVHTLSGWGRVPRVEAREILPASLEEARASVRDPFPPYTPRGFGRSYGDAGLPAAGHAALGTARLDRLLAFDPATGLLAAEAGVGLDRILDRFVPRGWFLPVVPGTSKVTLGGAVASNVHGKNHHRRGSLGDFVESLEVLTPLGPFTCSASERPGLFRATVGGYGLTGLITRVSLRLMPIRSPRMRVLRLKASGLDGLFRLFAAHDDAWEYSVAWLDALAGGRALGRGILMLGNHEEDPAPGHRGARAASRLRVPFALPAGWLRPSLLAALNGAYHRFGRAGGPAPEDLAGFFHPLDRVRDWNLLYGREGFFQYQCAIPDPGEAGIAACLEFLAGNGLGAFLSVLKRCGDDHPLLPFCRKGYTLALDIPNRGPATLRALDRLDEVVLRHGGRLYLTKDARLSRGAFRAMYPEWKAFMGEVRRWNPDGRSSSRLAERLGLWEA